METPPDQYGDGRFDAGLYVVSGSGDRNEWEVRLFESGSFAESELPEGFDRVEEVRSTAGRTTRPEWFEPGDLVAVVSLRRERRRGVTVSALSFEPIHNTLYQRTTESGGDLTVTADDGWTAISPDSLSELSRGDLLYATSTLQVDSVEGSAVIGGWPEGKDRFVASTSSGGSLQVYNWDSEKNKRIGERRNPNKPLFTPYVPLVYRSPPDDTIRGLTQGTDTGPFPPDPFFESDLPAGLDLDPFFQSADEVEELVGETIWGTGSSGIVKQFDVFAPATDGAGVRMDVLQDGARTGIEQTYYIPAANRAEDTNVEIVAVPSDSPAFADTSDLAEYVRENYISDEPQEFTLGRGPGSIREIRAVVTAAEPGDRFDLISDANNVPTGEMVAVDPPSFDDSDEVTMRPVNGSRDYVLVVNDSGGGRSPRSPLRLRVRDGFDAVGRVDGFTVQDGEPVDADTSTADDPESSSVSGRNPDDPMDDLYAQLPFSRREVRRMVEDSPISNVLDSYEGIGPATVSTLNSFGIETAADLGLVVRDERATGADAYEPLVDALAELGTNQQSAVLEAARTVQDVALVEPFDREGLSLPLGDAIMDGDLDPPGRVRPDFPITAPVTINVPIDPSDDSDRVVVESETSDLAYYLEDGDVDAVTDSIVAEAVDIIDLAVNEEMVELGQEVAVVAFPDRANYEYEYVEDFTQTKPEEEFEISRRGGDDAPSDTSVPLGEPLEEWDVIGDGKVLVYPQEVYASAARGRTVELPVSPPEAQETLRENDNFQLAENNQGPFVETNLPDRVNGWQKRPRGLWDNVRFPEYGANGYSARLRTGGDGEYNLTLTPPDDQPGGTETVTTVQTPQDAANSAINFMRRTDPDSLVADGEPEVDMDGESNRPGMDVPEPNTPEDDAPTSDPAAGGSDGDGGGVGGGGGGGGGGPPRPGGDDPPMAFGRPLPQVMTLLEDALPGTLWQFDVSERGDRDAEVDVFWTPAPSGDIDFTDTGVSVTAFATNLESLIRQAVRGYYEQVQPSGGEASEITELVADSELDLPDPEGKLRDESPAEEAAADTSPSSRTRQETESDSELFSRSALVAHGNQIEDLKNKGSEGQIRGVSDQDAIDAFEPLEGDFLDAVGDLVQGLAVSQQADPGGVFRGFNISAPLTAEGGDRIAGSGIFAPISTPAPIDGGPEAVESIVRVIQALDTERGRNPELHERLTVMEQVEDNQFRQGDVDFDNMFLTGAQIRTFATHIPALYDQALPKYLESVDSSYRIAQLAYAWDTAGETFRDRFFAEREQLAAGSRALAVWNEAREAVESGTFDPVEFTREFWRVPAGERSRGDVVEETREAMQDAISADPTSETDELIGQPGGVETFAICAPGVGDFGIQFETVDGGTELDQTNGDVELSALEVDAEVMKGEYEPGDRVARVQIAEGSTKILEVFPPAGEPEPEPDPSPTPSREDPQPTQDPTESRSREPEPSRTQTPPETQGDREPAQPEPRRTETRDTQDRQPEPDPQPTGQERQGGSMGTPTEIGTVETDEVNVDRVNVDTVRTDEVEVDKVDVDIRNTGGLDVGSVDPEVVSEIRGEIEDQINDEEE